MTYPWTRGLSIDGAEASVSQLTVAWADWAVGTVHTRYALEVALRNSGVVGMPQRNPYELTRLAKVMLQLAKKASVIRFEQGRWHFVRAPE